MNEPPRDVIALLKGELAVSCQALPNDPLNSLAMLVALAKSAEAGGAAALRVCGLDVVKAVRAACSIPIIGITKHADRTKAYITPTLADAQALVDAGADIVAIDATDRERPDAASAVEFVSLLANKLPIPIMADVSTKAEGIAAFEAGAALVSTTLSGYTSYSQSRDAVDLDLIRELAGYGKVIAEGRIHNPEALRHAFDAGAYAAVVGRAITRPQDIVQHFLAALDRSPRTTVEARRFGAPSGPSAADGAVGAWLGIDGGQSGLRVTLATTGGQVVRAETDAIHASLLTWRGQDEFESALRRVTSKLTAIDSDSLQLRSAYLALTGISAGTPLERAATRSAEHVLNAEIICAGSDITAAQAGAFAGGPGIVAVAGTGSSVFGRGGSGTPGAARAGGWGFLFGDECGAVGIVISAIRESLAVLDSAGRTDELGTALGRELAPDGDLSMVPKYYYAGRLTREALAASAHVVTRMADAGDSRARSIISTAAGRLAEQIQQVARRTFRPGETVPWSAVGGVCRGYPRIVDRIGEALSAGGEFVFEARAPLLSPADGAVLLASQRGDAADFTITDMRQRLLQEEAHRDC